MDELKKQRNDERSRISVLRQLAALEKMSAEQLREKWLDLYGEKAPNYRKSFLLKRLAYRVQELFHGGLSAPAKECLKEIAAKDPVATVKVQVPEARQPQDSILPGTRFVRIWHKRRYEVIARETGFEYEGQIYRSLSAVARTITGTQWNGKIFFGVKRDYRKKKEAADA
ncbi:DUF2924 domain-containing protein [Pontiellaceae bacterium B12219]|nr:DUF2924 domain-containing protein [Pontiellaceae bacterium B12219]